MSKRTTDADPEDDAERRCRSGFDRDPSSLT
jgi:hypothetical protein